MSTITPFLRVFVISGILKCYVYPEYLTVDIEQTHSLYCNIHFWCCRLKWVTEKPTFFIVNIYDI